MQRRVTAILLGTGYALTTLWALAVRASLDHYARNETRPLLLRPFAFGVGLLVANAITVRLGLKIGADYPAGSRMRLAWGLAAWGAACELAHYLLQYAGFAMQRTGGPLAGPLLLASQAAHLVGVCLLLGGLAGMRAPFARLGLGRLRAADKMAVAAIVAAMPVLFLLRDAGGGGNRSPVIESLQMLDPFLIAGGAIVAVLLNRTRHDLEGGFMGVALGYVVALAAVRLAALVAVAVSGSNSWIHAPFTAASLASDWFLTLAFYYRSQLTAEAKMLAEEYAGADG